MSRVTTSFTPVPPPPDDASALYERPVRHAQFTLRWVVLGLVAGALLTFAPLWVPLVLAAWSAVLARPLQRRLARLVGGRTRAGGVVTVALVITVLTPIVIMVLSLSSTAIDLITRVSHTDDGTSALSALLSGDSEPEKIDFGDTRQVFDLLRRHGASAVGAARTLTGAATAIGVALFVFVFAFYTFLVEGGPMYRWLEERSPLSRAHTARFASAFEETGRGLVISMGGTSLIQGGLATIGYLIIGAPQALLLGMLTSLGSFIPIVGTALVWVPLTLALLALGRSGQAIAVVVIGIVVSMLDNFIRPWLSRYGQLQLPTFVIFLAMLGGLAAFGGAGPLLGPLLVRLAAEALAIWSETNGRPPLLVTEAGRASDPPPAS